MKLIKREYNLSLHCCLSQKLVWMKSLKSDWMAMLAIENEGIVCSICNVGDDTDLKALMCTVCVCVC